MFQQVILKCQKKRNIIMCFHTFKSTVIYPKLKINNVTIDRVIDFKGTDHVGTFMGLKCVVYYAN